eukprot:8387789-Pyramimonas_sp.AAC.3
MNPARMMSVGAGVCTHRSPTLATYRTLRCGSIGMRTTAPLRVNAALHTGATRSVGDFILGGAKGGLAARLPTSSRFAPAWSRMAHRRYSRSTVRVRAAGG